MLRRIALTGLVLLTTVAIATPYVFARSYGCMEQTMFCYSFQSGDQGYTFDDTIAVMADGFVPDENSLPSGDRFYTIADRYAGCASACGSSGLGHWLEGYPYDEWQSQSTWLMFPRCDPINPGT